MEALRVEEDADRLVVRLRGVLSREGVLDLGARLRGSLGERLPDSAVLLDLTEVTECGVEACQRMAVLQRKLGARGLRTAYLCDRARIHGAAWWIVHASKDQRATPVSTLEQAERWFDSRALRVDELHDRAPNASAALRRRTTEVAE